MTLPSAYSQQVGIVYSIKERSRDLWIYLRTWSLISRVTNLFSYRNRDLSKDFEHIGRRKKWWELVLLSGTVCGIEFCYAAETAFVSPTLLSLGLQVKYMTMIWCLSPAIGFFVTPLLGSLSDSCGSPLGRRRPFIILLSIGIIIGLVLVPNGKDIGIALGDPNDSISLISNKTESFNSTVEPSEGTKFNSRGHVQTSHAYHQWGIFFTVIGTILLDFCSDACQSPARTYLLDVTVEEDHGKGLSTFTVMAGFGGSIGYAMSGVEWESTSLGNLLGNHVRTVFTVISVIFVICVVATITSFREVPLNLLHKFSGSCSSEQPNDEKYHKFSNESDNEEENVVSDMKGKVYGAVDPFETLDPQAFPSSRRHSYPVCNDIPMQLIVKEDIQEEEVVPEKAASPECDESPSIKQYLSSIVWMPKSLRTLCLTNLFCWMSLVCYSLYFTDFVGESVFHGDPAASEDSEEYEAFQKGVRFGCWGMALYSISCSFYSYVIERLVNKLGAKPVYIGGQLVYSIGMIIMALARNKIAVIMLSTTAGIMYATLFTMPYLLISHYHYLNKFDDKSGSGKRSHQVRGIGTDVATVSSMVFLAQFILSTCMGSIITAIKSPVAVLGAASILSALGALTATQVLYLNL